MEVGRVGRLTKGIYDLETEKRVLRVMLVGGRVGVVVNERVYSGSETYVMWFSGEELVNYGLRRIKEVCDNDE